ncbi:MAG: replication-associated recombination protein A [Bifidobacteriaceae bacterium]|jgi:putative ATPase|nr:replication-associated recombination protein A [Bifidobacteriaceae bacterium]
MNHADQNLPLSTYIRPRDLKGFFGQTKYFSGNSILAALINGQKLHSGSVLLYGPPGTGKTTVAYLIKSNSIYNFEEVSAVNATVKDLREIIDEAKNNLILQDKSTVLFVDEIHRFSKAQQDVLLPAVENGLIILVGATTENPGISIIRPLLSRSFLATFSPLEADELTGIIKNALNSDFFETKPILDDEAIDLLVYTSGGDARKALTILEVTYYAVHAEKNTAQKKTKSKKSVPIKITADDLKQNLDSAFYQYDKNADTHYDVASAFIKSMRGSDVDAALHYLARMIVGGEDPRFIARRIMIAASEEVGVADNSVLQTVVAAATAVEKIGFPEARIILSQAVITVALAPKSNATYLAIDAAIAELNTGILGGPDGGVPTPLRDQTYLPAKRVKLKPYLYAHDFPYHIVKQQYLPDVLEKKNTRYYFPSEHGDEKTLAKRLDKIREILKG